MTFVASSCLYKLEQAGEILVDSNVMIEKGRRAGGEIRVQGVTLTQFRAR